MDQHNYNQKKRPPVKRKPPVRRKKNNAAVYLIIAAAVILSALCIILIVHHAKSTGTKNAGSSSGTKTTVSQTTSAAKASTATVLSTGDVLIHKEIFTNAKTSDGSYDFNYCFEYAKNTISAADYAVCNLEVTLADGTSGYSFYPFFQVPDSIVTALKNAGFDMCVTANNHSGDGGASGLTRTVKVTRAAGLATTGTKETASEKNYKVVDVNGIKIGMIDYTFAKITDDGRVSLNGNAAMSADESACINAFDYDRLDAFYSAMKTNIANMKKDGAEAVMLYIHWGTEYSTAQSEVQEQIAQKMCDLGVDVIIGGHPHVIEPVDVLTNSSGHKTVCLYSDGNLLSNQRTKYMSDKSGHTEDGIFFYTTFKKDTKGKVTLASVSYVPTWVNYYSKGGKTYHQIVPLSDLSDPSALGLGNTVNGAALAQASKDRTDALVAAGAKKFA